MLECLRIKNLAVIEDLTWELGKGLNILTGETGAGKSILIDAFNLLLGERADKNLIRSGEEQCSVEGMISNTKYLNKFLEDRGIDVEKSGELSVKRTFTQAGSNKQFINGSPTTLQTLKELGDLLVDLHGPHDHQLLLSTDHQLSSLDAYAKLEKQLLEYKELWSEQLKDQKKLVELNNTASGDVTRQLDLLDYQINEIEKAEINVEQDEGVENEFSVASNQRSIVELGSSIKNILSEGENDVLSQLGTVQRQLEEWQRMDANAKDLSQINLDAVAQLQELNSQVDDLLERTDMDGERLHYLEQRISLLQTLKRKYGGSLESIVSRLQDLTTQREELAGREGIVKEIEKRLTDREKKLSKLADKLHEDRAKAAPKLAKEITQQLQELGFKKASFGCQVELAEVLNAHGKDKVEFQFAPNVGETARALRAIASSGEMARVMLAVKTVLAEQDEVPILIFDEVDANVGGETAITVGKKLRHLGTNHQVLCITHLPQVASAGHVHYRVEKREKAGRAYTEVVLLEKKEREEELARMLGGQNTKSIALAKEMLAQV
jgi:DNA repair protein RecN (Recombination protein N)